jgi:outer membrane protein
MKRIFLLFFVVLLGFTSKAQIDTTARKWTLREIIDYAIAHNLTVKRSNYAVETGEINYRQSKAVMLPTLNASGSQGYNWGRNIDPTTNVFTEERIESANISANSSLLLWNGFRLFYSMKQSDVELDALNQDMIKSRNDVILNVITLYLNVVFNKELYAVAQFQLKSSQEQWARTKRLSDAGSVPLGDVLNLDAQVATNEVNVIQQENSLNLSLLQLKQALQLPSSTPMDIELPQVDIENELVTKSAEEIFEIATMSMPEIKAAELRKRSASYFLRSTKGSLYPRLSLNASYSSVYSDQRSQVDLNGPVTVQTVPVGYVGGSLDPVFREVSVPTTYVPSYINQFQDNRGANLGFSLQIPIFNGLQTRSAIQRAAINRDIADINLLETKNSLRQLVETAYNNAQAAIKTYQSTEKQVRARDEAFRMTKQRYGLGGVNFVDYQIAENNLFQAQSDLLRAKYDFIFRKKVLDFYQGLPLGL